MARGLAFVLLVIACADCAPRYMKTGAPMPPPSGAVQFCHDNPTDELCRNKP